MNLLFAAILISATPYTPATVTVAGSLAVNGNTLLDGTSSAPGVSTNCESANTAGVVVREGSGVTISGSASVLGNPPVKIVNADTFDQNYLFTQEQLDFLRQYAKTNGTYIKPTNSDSFNLTVTDGLIFVDTVNGVALGNPPDSYTLANVKITSANNTGHIVVMGSVTIDGDVTYNGLIYALNNFQYKGTGTGKIEGALVSANVIRSVPTVVDTKTLGNSKVYHDCVKASLDCSQVLGFTKSNDLVNYTTLTMPDSAFSNQSAELDVRRVKPKMFPGCDPKKAMVFIQGQKTTVQAAFDLEYKDYSLMESLASKGVDCFAFNGLGFGKSRLTSVTPDPFMQPCNASLPQCSGVTCSADPGVCDCQGLPANQSMNQQGSTRYLNPNPVTSKCPHTSNKGFEKITNQVDELRSVVNYALSKSGLSKVVLMSWSVGTPVLGKYLGDNDFYSGENLQTRQAKVEKAVFLSPSFGSAAERVGPTWPLALMDKADSDATFNPNITCLGGDGCKAVGCVPADPDCNCTVSGPNCCPSNDPSVCCPGQEDPNIRSIVWQQTTARDSVGSAWGPQPLGLSRFPIVVRFGWNATQATNITTPVLIIHGKKDTVLSLSTSNTLCNALPGGICTAGSLTGPKILLQPNCMSHAGLWEGLGHTIIEKNVEDFVLTGMIFASPGDTSGVFGTDNNGVNYHLDQPVDANTCECGTSVCTPDEEGFCNCVDNVCQ